MFAIFAVGSCSSTPHSGTSVAPSTSACFDPVRCTGSGEDECAPHFRCVPDGHLGAGSCAPTCIGDEDCPAPYKVCLHDVDVCLLDDSASKSPEGDSCERDAQCQSGACRGAHCCAVGGALDATPIACSHSDAGGDSCPSGLVCIRPAPFLGHDKCAPRCRSNSDCKIGGEACYPEGFCNPAF